MTYYYCVNCGHYGDFTFDRQRNLKCEKCAYDDLCELDEEEWKEYTNRYEQAERTRKDTEDDGEISERGWESKKVGTFRVYVKKDNKTKS